MNRGAAVAHGVIAALVLALAFSAGAGVAGAQQRGTGDNDTVDVDVRVWQHVRDPLRIYVSARPEGGDWDTLGTIRLLLDDGLSSDRAYRFGDITVADFEVRVWQHVRDPLRIHISARPVGGDWDTLGTIRLLLDDGHSSSGNYRYGDSPPERPAVTVSPGGEDVLRLAILTIAFRDSLPEADAGDFIEIDPPTEGTFVRADDRTLLFQPAYPGWLRGQSYRVVVEAGTAGLPQDHSHTFTVEGKLEVVYVIPGDGDTEVPATAQILVQFNRSVAPLTVLQEGPAPRVLEFDPPLVGRGEWLNTSLYRFIPANLQPSTEYSVRIPAGLTSAADGVLQSEHTWTFSTIQPAVTDLTPHDGSLRVEPDTAIVVTFNQPMNRASVKAGVVLREEGADLIAASFAWSERDTVVTLAPDEPLALGASYTVLVPVGLSGASGGATRFERIVRFTTIEPPRLLSTSPEDGETAVPLWRSVRLTYNNPMDPDSFEGRVSISGIGADDIQVDWWRGNPEEVGLRFDPEPSTTYTVRIAEGVRDRGGRSLPAYEFSFTTLDPSLEPSVSIQAPGAFATWAEGDPHVLRYYASGHGAVRFQLYRLSESEARDLLSRAYIFNYASYVPFVPGSDPIREWTEQFREDTRTLRSTDLGNGAPLPKGDYYLATFLGERFLDYQELVFSVVDTAVVTKLVHGELLVWALDYDTGEPLAGMEVTSTVGLYTRAALEDLAEAEAADDSDEADDAEAVDDDPVPPPSAALTDRNGIATFPTEAYEDRAVRITEGGRLGVGATWWNQNSGPTALPIYKPQWVTHLYTERPIYRPGESVFYRGVVRSEDDATYSLPEGEERFQVRLRKRYGNVLPLAPVSLDELGTFSGEFVLPDGAPTGTYYVSLLYDGKSVAYTSFTVAEFRAPEFEVGIEPASADFVDGDRILVEATARFFFGGPVADAAVNWSARASPTQFRVEGYETYSFSNRDYHRESVYRDPLRSRGDAQTEGSGFAQFHVPAALDEGEGTQILTISATVTDASEQAVAASATVTVHPAAWYAGVRPESSIARAGEPTTIHLVTVDFKGEIAPGRPVALRIYEREWVTTRTESVNGYRYRSEPHNTEIEVHSIQTNAHAEASLTFTPPSAGTYRLVAESTDDEGRVASSARSLWVSGRDRASWPGQDSDRFDLVPDRESYAVGDVAEVLVPAPYPGATALVTIERGRVLSTEVRTFETNSEVLRIPIEDAHLPNVFVSVVLYRPPTEDDPVPRYNVGYAKLLVSTAPRRLEVRIEPDREQAAPGETVRYEVQVTDAEGNGVEAAVSVAIVDKAVLSLADQFEADAMQTFWYERTRGVWTASSLVVSLERLNETPRPVERWGDSPNWWRWNQEYSRDPSDPPPPCPNCFSAGPPRDPPPLNARSDFQNTALWLGQLTTDEDGRAGFELNLPDNATTWRARARAADADTRVGEGESELLVTQPLLVRPALPRFLRVGDEVTVRALVRNGTDTARTATVTLEAEGVVLDSAATLTASVQPDRSAVFEWSARAREEGTATFLFSATAPGGYGDAIELSIPVYLDVTPETTATGGVVDGGFADEAVYLPDYVITGSGSLEVLLQASLVGALDLELPHLALFKKESTVRVASRVVATIAVQRVNAGGLTVEQQVQLKADLAYLANAQRYDGGWPWCRTCRESDLWVTGWVLIALGEAQGADHTVADYAVTRSARLIAGHVNRETDIEDPADPNQHAFLLYALARASNVSGEVSELAAGQAGVMRTIAGEHRAQLTSWGRAYLLLGLLATGHSATHEAVRTLLNDLTATTIASANGNHWEAPYIRGSMHNGSVRATALVLRALAEVEPRHPLIEETTRWLVVARAANWWKTSVGRAQAMASLGSFAALTGETRGVYDYRVLLNTRQILAGDFNVPAHDYYDGTAIALDELPLGEVSRVRFEREADRPGRMYYALNLRYVTPAAGVGALNRGFAVSHRYSLLEEPDRRISSASLGDVVRVTVTVVAPADRVFVKVEDFLPGGLEPIDPRLNIVPIALRQQALREQPELLRDSAPWYGWYYSPWDQVDLRDDRLVLVAGRLPQGVYEYVYYARATTPGDFFVAPTHAEETYFPEVFGRSDSSRFTIHASD